MHANNIKHHNNDDDLDDIETLRRIAMESINSKKMKEVSTAHQPFQSQSQSAENLYLPPSHPPYLHATSSFPPARLPRLQQFHMRPRFHSNHNTMNFPPQFGAPFPHPHPAQPPMHQDFVSIPHVNPQFQPIFQPEYIHPPAMEFMPTIPARLSPRSLEFVESNKMALMRSRSKSPNGRRRYSRESRSRSRSPARRSPYKRRSPNGPSNRNIKRYRSKSPSNNRTRKTSSEKEGLHKNRNNSRRNNTWRNNNGNKFDRRRSESDNDEEDSIQSSQKSSQSERENNNDKQKNETVVETKEVASPVNEEKESTKSAVQDEPQQQQEVSREKTQDELEDELLASDDDLAIDIGVDENELDFLNDDSESENEGRFKDKPSLSTNKQSSNKSSSKDYEDSKAYNKSTRRDDKYKRKESENRSNSFYKKSLRNEENKKPLFKSTFKSVESEKTNEAATSKRSEKQNSTVKSTVMKADSNTKLSEKPTSTISKIDGTSKTSRIKERLGEYIGAKAKLTEGSKTLASSKQVMWRLYKPIKTQDNIKLSQISS